jgi:hypothetical protein
MFRLRPRFSVRTLAIFVTLVCAYFGGWEASKRAAPKQLRFYVRLDDENFKSVHNATSPAPLILRLEERHVFVPLGGVANSIRSQPIKYYLWLFGPMFELPFESEWMDPPFIWPLPVDLESDARHEFLTSESGIQQTPFSGSEVRED